jgi:hypothetical protein
VKLCSLLGHSPSFELVTSAGRGLWRTRCSRCSADLLKTPGQAWRLTGSVALSVSSAVLDAGPAPATPAFLVPAVQPARVTPEYSGNVVSILSAPSRSEARPVQRLDEPV